MDYKSNGRVVLECVIKELQERFNDDTINRQNPRQEAFLAGIGYALGRLEIALEKLARDDEETEARVLRNYFYGDACGAFEN